MKKCGRGKYDEALIFILLMASENAGQIMARVIKKHLKYYLSADHKSTIENLSIGWGLSILKYLDELNRTQELAGIFVSPLWLEFERNVRELPYYEGIKNSLTPTYRYAQISQLMERVRTYNASA